MSDDATTAIGIDIGGTGIKGAIVDVATGELRSERVKLPTPQGGEPEDIVATVKQIIEELGEVPAGTPLGVCFPAAIVHGTTMSAANVAPTWIGLEAEKLFEERLGLGITFVNDADAAGYAEARYGAAKDVPGLVIMTTLGTGIGTALIHDGVLIPNAELGHMSFSSWP
jgi:polyphosphate glucokinase